MKVTVDISDKDLIDVIRFSGEKKKGPAISKFITNELMLMRRREISNEVLSGKIRIDFSRGDRRGQKDRITTWEK